ncbi:murein L,D-transpeptidase catalytic domain-containing protein [Bacteroides sp.]|uniref:murein L,D-transpeptidase catalytic domain-containing protein n=1 Tax=Bacteroides sp. TaxID=29523 RepID=UPI002630A249|nr:murein L,D-transpeptidase catalytic domain family protein [Bacteroides sp.]MDD3040698.1 murein L,D-transpeptidase catalytic domain family protein [Bacteroides sp.]
MREIFGIILFLFYLGSGFTIYAKGLGVVVSSVIEKRLKEKAVEAKKYCEKKGFDTNYCFLVDFSIHSGKNRFFIWDFKGDSVKCASLCAHGYGMKSTLTRPVYSNVEGSHCSSLGKYKIGARAYSKWGINIHYKLHGLETTNSNAFKRYVMLHSYTPIPIEEIYPSHLALGLSEGCPVICDNTMKEADKLLRMVKKPLLLWIFE